MLRITARDIHGFESKSILKTCLGPNSWRFYVFSHWDRAAVSSDLGVQDGMVTVHGFTLRPGFTSSNGNGCSKVGGIFADSKRGPEIAKVGFKCKCLNTKIDENQFPKSSMWKISCCWKQVECGWMTFGDMFAFANTLGFCRISAGDAFSFGQILML